MVYWLRMSIVLLFFTLPIQAQVQAQESESDKIDCDNVMSDFDIGRCAHRDYEKADKELNEVYHKLLALHEQDVQEERERVREAENSGKEYWDSLKYYELSVTSLRQSQRDWIKFREGYCTYVTSLWTPGTAARIIHPACLRNLTQEQTKRLREDLEDIERREDLEDN